MSTREVILQAHGLSRTFSDGGRTATILDGVSITLRRSEVVLLMGPSGSGKSTLLAILSGLLKPTAGRVMVQGEDLWGASERQREQIRQRHFGFIFQGCNLFPALTARQQLEIVLRWWGGVSIREARQRSERMLGLFGLGERMHQRPAELSGGEKQRVAVGRALVKQPTLCFADEPTSALDWDNGKEVVSLLRATARQQKAAVLMVSHDDRVKAYADRVLELSDHRLLEQSGSRTALPEPASLQVPEYVL